MHVRFRPAVLLVLLLVVAPTVVGQAPRPSRTVAIINGTVLTVTHGTIPRGTVVLRDGRIAAVGATIAVPPDAEVVDARGRFVAPGIVDCHTHVAADTMETINETGTNISSMVRIEDVINPTDIGIYRVLGGGVTTMNVLHGSDNAIGGQSAVIKLRWGVEKAEDLLFDGAVPGIKFALGENVKQTGEPVERYPRTRPGIDALLRQTFTRARAYQREWQEYEKQRAAGTAAVPPRRDLELDPIVEILEGRRLVHAHAYRADEILMLIRVADDFGFRIATFQHALEAYKVAPEIAKHGAGASIFTDWWGYKVEAIDAIPYNARILQDAGVLVSVNSDLTEWARRLNTEAAKTVRWGGLSDDDALKLVTINPAKQLRIDARVGSLDAGKDGDVVIWSHHPLSSYALADRVYVDGELRYDRQDDERRVAAVAAEKQRRREAEGAPAALSPPASSTPAKAPVAATAVAAGPGSARPQHANGGSLAIVNARIHPVSGPQIANGTVLVRDGLITEVGPGVVVPKGVKTIDARGDDLYPGWINARTTVGIVEPGPSGYGDADELGEFNPQDRAAVAYHNDSEAIPIARANGVTTVAVTPAGGVIPGQIAVMHLDGRTWEESAVQQNAGIALTFPSVPLFRPVRGARERPYADLKAERDARLDALAKVLDRARAYATSRDRSDPRTIDLALEALVPVVERRLPVFVRADREEDIRDAVVFADRANLRIVINGGIEAPFVAPMLKARDIPVIVGPVLQMTTREDLPHAASYRAAGELAAAGVRVAFATGDTNNVRLLPFHAARSVAWGLSHEAAIRALTLDAASILGVGDRLGSIEPGKIADFVLVKGDPLEVRSEVLRVIINGRDVGLDNAQLALYEKYRRR